MKGMNEMFAGNSQHPIGTKIKITYISSKDDKELKDSTGKLTHPFGAFPANYVGVYLDKKRYLR